MATTLIWQVVSLKENVATLREVVETYEQEMAAMGAGYNQLQEQLAARGGEGGGRAGGGAAAGGDGDGGSYGGDGATVTK